MLKWITFLVAAIGSAAAQHTPYHPFGLGLNVADKAALLGSL